MKKILLSLSIFLALATVANAQAFYRNSETEQVAAQGAILNMFPNPALNNTTVVLNYIPRQRMTVDIVDFNGNVRRSFAFSPGGRQLSFDVGFLEAGYYVVRVREAGRLVDRTKLLKS